MECVELFFSQRYVYISEKKISDRWSSSLFKNMSTYGYDKKYGSDVWNSSSLEDISNIGDKLDKIDRPSKKVDNVSCCCY